MLHYVAIIILSVGLTNEGCKLALRFLLCVSFYADRIIGAIRLIGVDCAQSCMVADNIEFKAARLDLRKAWTNFVHY